MLFSQLLKLIQKQQISAICKNNHGNWHRDCCAQQIRFSKHACQYNSRMINYLKGQLRSPCILRKENEIDTKKQVSMKTKRVLLLILATLMIVSMFACGADLEYQDTEDITGLGSPLQEGA
ncbi:MAG TPA: hypothetical protein DCY10_05430, partial [Clostridiales bacterium]|nr:hypothetical protein [Clostridiales bacterium]